MRSPSCRPEQVQVHHINRTHVSLHRGGLEKSFLARELNGSNFKRPQKQMMDNSPLINGGEIKIKPMTPENISHIIRNLYVKAEILTAKQNGRRFDVNPYGLRKFFLTQMISLGVNRDYTEYMMGHKLSTYLTVRSLGIEYLRSVYLSSGLSIKPRTKQNKIRPQPHHSTMGIRSQRNPFRQNLI